MKKNATPGKQAAPLPQSDDRSSKRSISEAVTGSTGATGEQASALTAMDAATDAAANAPSDVELAGSIWFRSNQHNWGSQKRMALLAAIKEKGSITAAAKAIGLSYKAAWDAVDTMNNLTGQALV